MVLFHFSGSQSIEFTVQYGRTVVSHYRFVVTIHFSHNEVGIYRLFRTYFYTLQSSVGGVSVYLSFYLGLSRLYFEAVAVFDRHTIANYDTGGFYYSNSPITLLQQLRKSINLLFCIVAIVANHVLASQMAAWANLLNIVDYTKHTNTSSYLFIVKLRKIYNIVHKDR